MINGVPVKGSDGLVYNTRTQTGADNEETQVIQNSSDGLFMRLFRVFQNFTFSFPGTTSSALNVSLLSNQGLGTINTINTVSTISTVSTVSQSYNSIGDMSKYVSMMNAQALAVNTGIYNNFKRV
jgi:hypothetical protein